MPLPVVWGDPNGEDMTLRNFQWPEGIQAAVSLSFDDARCSQIDNGVPVLAQYDLKATFYVGMERMEKRLDGWRQAVAAGHEIGNHSWSHSCSGNHLFSRDRALESYTLEQMDEDIARSDRRIRDLLGVRPRTFAYPCGQTFVGRGAATRSYVPLVARRYLAGRGYMCESHNAPEYCDLARLFGYAFDTQPLGLLIALIEQAVNDGGWVVFCGHEVGTEGFQNIEKSKLEAVCRYLVERRESIWTSTVATVAGYVGSRAASTSR